MVSKWNLLKAIIKTKYASIGEFEKAYGYSWQGLSTYITKNKFTKYMADKMGKLLGVDLSNFIVEPKEIKHRYTQDIYGPTNYEDEDCL